MKGNPDKIKSAVTRALDRGRSWGSRWVGKNINGLVQLALDLVEALAEESVARKNPESLISKVQANPVTEIPPISLMNDQILGGSIWSSNLVPPNSDSHIQGALSNLASLTSSFRDANQESLISYPFSKC